MPSLVLDALAVILLQLVYASYRCTTANGSAGDACTKDMSLPKKAIQRENARIDPRPGDPIALRALLSPVAIKETEMALCISVPLTGVDARDIYILASAYAIAVEIRKRDIVPHAGVIYRECQKQCVTRELEFRSAIKKGSTSVRISTNKLEITCSKDLSAGERTWSEFVRFNTRESFGGV